MVPREPPPAPQWPRRPSGPKPAVLAAAIAFAVLSTVGLVAAALGHARCEVRTYPRTLEERAEFVLRTCGQTGPSFACSSTVDGTAQQVQQLRAVIESWESAFGPFQGIAVTNDHWFESRDGHRGAYIVLDARFGQTTKPLLLAFSEKDDQWLLEAMVIDPTPAQLEH